MSPFWSWVIIAAIGVCLVLFVAAADRMIDHWQDTVRERHRLEAAARRHPSSRVRYFCPICSDPNVLHLQAHQALAHGKRITGPEDSPDWGRDG
jgi:H+/Cl- antiporter ClcA